MQFKHPELLYALFLLLIPIFIHLFQLRKFQKVAFTNVAFLKKVTIQTRKSSQLKKWLTLLMRLLALACIILAFTQPFSASKTALNTEKETVLYIDNSFSMQAKGVDGPLLQRVLQQLYSKIIETNSISWFTNDYSNKNASVQDFKNEILAVNYSQKQLTPSEIILKATQLFSKNDNVEKRLIVVSDFQLNGAFPSQAIEKKSSLKIDVVQLKVKETKNISIDTAYILKKKLTVRITVHGDVSETIPISLYNNNVLNAKTAIDFSNQKTKLISFDIDDTSGFKGKIELNDPSLLFDNSLYFNINEPKKIKVLSLNESSSNFIQRIFNQEEFDFTQQDSESLNYSDFPEQNLIILNELKNIPESLSTAIKSFTDKGGSVFVIPSIDSNLENYNSLLMKLQMGSFSEIEVQEKKITQIVFDHPLYSDVFEKQVVNFQYPKVNAYYNLNTQATSVLRYEDGKPFIIQHNNSFVSTAPINMENSNFQSSPLIVPTLYNMAQHSLPLPKLYYEIGKQNTYAVPVKLSQDEILTLRDSTANFIPLQQTKETKVIITTEDEPNNAGVYSIEKEGQSLENVSYNYNRKESLLQYANPEDWTGVSVYDSVEELFNSIAEENTINSYWKWFVIFALLFLIFEMLILKFYK